MSDAFVDVLTADERFGRMLCIELERMGADVASAVYRTDAKAELGKHFVIADLDSVSFDELASIDEGCTLVGFSRRRENDIPELVRECNVFLHRPFRMSEMLSIIGDDLTDGNAPISTDKRVGVAREQNNVLRVNSERRCAVWGKQEIPLSDCEYSVLEMLCQRRGELVERCEIDALLGVSEGNMSDVYICHLRKKLDNRLGLKLICTVRSKGYILNN